MKPRRIVAESPRRIPFRETIEGNDRSRILRKRLKRFSIEWREFDIFDASSESWTFSRKKKQGDEGRKENLLLIFRVLEQNAWNRSKGWKIIIQINNFTGIINKNFQIEIRLNYDRHTVLFVVSWFLHLDFNRRFNLRTWNRKEIYTFSMMIQ